MSIVFCFVPVSLCVFFDTCADLSPTWGGKGAGNMGAAPRLNELKEDILNRAHARAHVHQPGSTARTKSADDALQRGSGIAESLLETYGSSLHYFYTRVYGLGSWCRV